MRAPGIFSTFSVAQTTDKTRDAVQLFSTRVSKRCAVSESDYSRKHALECLRLASDCMQLAGDVQDPALQSHFVRMVGVWSDLAVRGPNADARTESGYPDSESKQTGSPNPRENSAIVSASDGANLG